MRHQHRRGFTLIELAIVLVVIGLVVGSVLAGKELIANAEDRKVVSAVGQMHSAYSTFRLKYGCLAGDCDLTTRGLHCAYTMDTPEPTNENGLIDAASNENRCILDHLASANLVSRRVDAAMPDIDSVPINSGVALYDLFESNGPEGINPILMVTQYDTGYVNYQSNSCFARPVLTPLQARSIDQKTDDGLPLTGGVSAGSCVDDVFYVDTLIPVGPTGDGGACVTDDTVPAAYNNLRSSEKLCSLVIRLIK